VHANGFHPEAAPPGRVRRRPALTREQVFAAALRLIDADGVEALSMRRLGKVLDRDPMRLYRHAESKEALLDGVVELVLAELRVPPVHGGNWEAALRATAHAYRDMAVAHPHVVPLLVTRPLATPLAMRPLAALRPLEDLLELFVSAGFGDRDALYAYRFYMGFLNGHVLNELQEHRYDPRVAEEVRQHGMDRLPASEFPRLRSLAEALSVYDGVRELDEGLDVVITGLRGRAVGDGPRRAGVTP
jgi:AcrR family transcriptional regulator